MKMDVKKINLDQMKLKVLLHTLLLYGFLGLLWVIYMKQVIIFLNRLNQGLFIKGLFLFISIIFFWDLERRIYPYCTEAYRSFQFWGKIASFSVVIMLIYFL